jgi:hypothetical protein
MTAFDVFWEKYPRKVGKLDAQKAYTKALKLATPEDILAGVERSVKHWTDPRFIPYPATWLNGGRWMDEVPESSKSFRALWVCPHVDRCSHRDMCDTARFLGKPERVKAS